MFTRPGAVSARSRQRGDRLVVEVQQVVAIRTGPGPRRRLLGSARACVDAHADRRAFQGISLEHCLIGDLEQVRGRLALQRVARLRPTAALSALHDPLGQMIRPGVQST